MRHMLVPPTCMPKSTWKRMMEKEDMGSGSNCFFCSRSLHVTGVIRSRGPSLETVAQGSFAILPNKHGNSNHSWMSGSHHLVAWRGVVWCGTVRCGGGDGGGGGCGCLSSSLYSIPDTRVFIHPTSVGVHFVHAHSQFRAFAVSLYHFLIAYFSFFCVFSSSCYIILIFSHSILPFFPFFKYRSFIITFLSFISSPGEDQLRPSVLRP